MGFGVVHDFGGFHSLAEDVLERFQADIEPDPTAVFETIGDRPGRIGNLGGNIIEAVGDDSFGKGAGHLAADDFQRRVIDAWSHRILFEEYPNGMRLLGANLVEL